MLIRTSLSIVCGTAAALLLAATPAGASDARVDGGVLRVTAAPGEINGALVTPAGDGDLSVTDLGGAPAPGPGCAGDADGLRCTGAGSLAIALGDGDDSGAVDPEVRLSASIDGGPGADYLVGGGGDDTIAARDGEEDAIACGEGEDTVTADAQDYVDQDCEQVSTTEPAATGDDGAPEGSAGDAVQPGAAGGGGSSSTGAADERPARSRTGVAKCSSRGSRRSVVCSVRMRDPRPTGTIAMQLRNGPLVLAQGRGRIVGGVARIRMRARLPLVGARYTLRLAIDATDRYKLIRRSLSVAVLRGGPV